MRVFEKIHNGGVIMEDGAEVIFFGYLASYLTINPVATLQKILVGNQSESGRVVPSSPSEKMKYWSPEFC
jgi:hypothetical protein